MNDLFDAKVAEHYIGRINSLNQASKRQWGKMDVAQMFTHCLKPFSIADGVLLIKPNKIIRFLFAKKAKKSLLAGVPFKKNLPTFPEAIIVDPREFEKEKLKLTDTINAFTKKGESGVKNSEHPFFGEMTPTTWSILLSSHLDHHLSQFGA
ncbi:MAG: DUF1569 domain-containing protein [Bacteroidota bacterium]|nr:DUF1569 domain-containing protein [Bacteroidota bacterium]